MTTIVVNSDTDKSYDWLFPKDYTILHEANPDSPYIPWDEVDLVLLVGAMSDVDPTLYGEIASPECGRVDRLQDLNAMRYLSKAEDRKIPVVGICKGAQQMCVYFDGTLKQHVPRVGAHRIKHSEGIDSVPADHHQVMVPDGLSSIMSVNANDDLEYPEEVIFTSRCIGFQYHPEWDADTGYSYKRFRSTVEGLINA